MQNQLRNYTIYRIVCKDKAISNDCYIGATSDFEKRLIKHKSDTRHSPAMLYKHLREVAGDEEDDFDVHWTMEPITFLYNATFEEARRQEKHYVLAEGGTLNTIPPYSSAEDKRKRKQTTDAAKYLRNKDLYKARAKARYRRLVEEDILGHIIVVA